MIEKRWMDDLHAYLGGIVRELNGFPQCVGGVEDHVHLLVGLKATHTLSNFMRELKQPLHHGFIVNCASPDLPGRKVMGPSPWPRRIAMR